MSHAAGVALPDARFRLVDEAAWVARARNGDRAAFDWLVRRYERPLLAHAQRMLGDAEEARDLTQECFMRAWAALPRVGGDLQLSSWLYRIQTNACLDVLRHRKRVRWLPWDTTRHEHGAPVTPYSNPERAALAAETQQEVRRALDQLAPRHRAALVMREYDGLSCEQIGQALGISRSAAKSLLFRAREEFRQVYVAQRDRRSVGGRSHGPQVRSMSSSSGL
jgi:RNA polymerase sigma-70 factor (ECF subfamily)